MPYTDEIRHLTGRREQISKDVKALLDAAKADGQRALNTDEQAKFDALLAERSDIDRQVKNFREAERMEAADAEGEGRQTTHDPEDVGQRRRGEEPAEIRWRVGEHEYVVRPEDRNYGRCTVEYREAFDRYLRGDTGEARTLMASSNPDGGFLVPMQMSSMFVQSLDTDLWIRRLATTETLTAGGSLGVAGLAADPSDAEWTSEAPSTAISADTEMKFNQRELKPNALRKRIDISNRLIRQSSRPAEAIVRERGSYVTALAEEKAFLTGSGAGCPLGLFTASNAGISTSRDKRATGATTIGADDIISVYYNGKQAHRRNAVWIGHRHFFERCRKLKGSDNNYLWQPGLGGEPDTLMGRPIHESEFAPNTFTANQYVAIFGDLRYYHIVTSLDLEILSNPYLLMGSNKTAFFFNHESDGQPVLEEAFTRLQMAAS